MNRTDTLAIEIDTEIPPATVGQIIALCAFEGEPLLSRADGDALSALERLIREGDFKGEADTFLLLYAPDAASGGARRLLILGRGEHHDDDPASLGRTAAIAVRQATSAHAKELVFILPECYDPLLMARAVAQGAIVGHYDGGLYQQAEEKREELERLHIVVSEKSDELRAEVNRGRIVGEAVNWARALADEPGLSLPPREFARRAALMAGEFGLHVESLNAEEIRARGMGGLWGVGKGSNEEPALIVVRYEPDGASPQDELWAFVGKGITFDTGGISLKKPAGMEEMKSDMAGGAAVLGALRAIAQLRPRRRIVGIVPTAENMPSGKAIKPGDVIRTFAGYTIEIVDTDAEGRLVLVDGIAYAKHLGASRIVDLATLTGSIIVTLGEHRAGLFSNNDEWASRVSAAAERAGEPVWRMPVSDDYKKRIESPIADFKNYGGRPDAIAAALLLSKFAADTAWAHLDIAGTAWRDAPQSYAPKGATGTAVGTLVELAGD